MSKTNDVKTEGGASVGGSVKAGGDFIGRDQIVVNIASLSEQTLGALSHVLDHLNHEPSTGTETLFRNHIEPIYQNIKTIHKDYERTIFDLRRYLLDEERDLDLLIEWLMERSLVWRSDRNYLKNVHYGLGPVEEKLEIILNQTQSPNLIGRFCAEIVEYFTAYTMEMPTSLYFYLIEQLTSIRKEENKSQNLQPVDGSKKPDDETLVDRLIQNLGEEELMENWQAITQTYLEMRGRYLP